MQEISRALRKLVRTLDELSLPHMLIGGWALPAYGRIRATLDTDIAVAADFPAIENLYNRLVDLGYTLPSSPRPEAPVFLVTDLENRVEFEIWTKPDGVTFDSELLRRRIRVRPFNDDFEIFAIGPEDFIVNKLARTDRGVQDEQDAVSVLKRQEGRLDYPYLVRRAKDAEVGGILKTLMDQVP